jgi:hypothetical protein
VGSHLLVMHTDELAAKHRPEALPTPDRTWVLPDHWAFRRLDPNVVTLDFCAIQLGDGPWSDPKPVWQAHREAVLAGPGTPFAIRFDFEVEVLPATIELVLECPERFKMAVNNQPVPCLEHGYWRDISFKRVEIQPKVQLGQNVIELTGLVAEETEIENAYLIGDFGVAARRIGRERYRVNGMNFDRYAPQLVLTEEAADGNSQHLNQLGYPFYAGTLSLSQSVEIAEPLDRVVLSLEGLNAIVADVWINGQQAGVAMLPPYQVDVTEQIMAGTNEIEVRLVTSLRNLLGPLHRVGGDPDRIWPHDFVDMSNWTNDYIFVPLGFDRVCLLISRAGV